MRLVKKPFCVDWTFTSLLVKQKITIEITKKTPKTLNIPRHERYCRRKMAIRGEAKMLVDAAVSCIDIALPHVRSS